MTVIFAPDYRADNPYQDSLAESLAAHGCPVLFLSDYKRGLPLTRGARAMDQADAIFHLHWPDAYFRAPGWKAWARALRYPLDLQGLGQQHPIILTAHNLLPHCQSPLSTANVRRTYQKAARIIVHSEAAGLLVSQTHQVPEEKVTVIPHGDLSTNIPPLPSQAAARQHLALPADEHFGLMFGALSPYKGIEAAAQLWQASKIDARLYIVGDSFDPGYGDSLEQALEAFPLITLLRQRVSDHELAQWLAAADCALFNYTSILTSGSACLARSVGLPLVLPSRLNTLDLQEPHAHVHRFENDTPEAFAKAVADAFEAPRDHSLTDAWRESTSWHQVASQTHQAYSQFIAA